MNRGESNRNLPSLGHFQLGGVQRSLHFARSAECNHKLDMPEKAEFFLRKTSLYLPAFVRARYIAH